jgi:hypothetical protein
VADPVVKYWHYNKGNDAVTASVATCKWAGEESDWVCSW